MCNKELPWKYFYTLDPQVFPPVNGDGDGTATIRDRNVSTGGRVPRQVKSPVPPVFVRKGSFVEVDMAALQHQPIFHLCSEAVPLYGIPWYCQGYGT